MINHITKEYDNLFKINILKVDDFILNALLGKGLSKNKIEGDKKTPIGQFQLENLYYRKIE